jgi:hypothetical protein
VLVADTLESAIAIAASKFGEGWPAHVWAVYGALERRQAEERRREERREDQDREDRFRP